jgi:hypothetical protein
MTCLVLLSYLSLLLYLFFRSWSSSVIVVSAYRMDDRGSIPAEAKDFFSSLCVKSGFDVHPASNPMGIGGPFPWGKMRLGRYADHSPHQQPRSWMSRSCTSCLLHAWRVMQQLYGLSSFYDLLLCRSMIMICLVMLYLLIFVMLRLCCICNWLISWHSTLK